MSIHDKDLYPDILSRIGRGPAGPEGPQGQTGPQGPQSPQGPAGPQGPQGPAGADGAEGPRGPQGLKGNTGATGETGPQGPRGLTGPQGPQGPQGPAGSIGARGYAGPEGPQGPQGPQGPAGEESVFWCEYGVTTWQEVKDAIDAGKLPMFVKAETVDGFTTQLLYKYTGMADPVSSTNQTMYFTVLTTTESWTITLNKRNVWKASALYLMHEITSNKLASTAIWVSNDTKFPTTKAGDARWDQIFWCAYGTTTAAQIQAALDAGKMPICNYTWPGETLPWRYTFASETSTTYRFTCQAYAANTYEIVCKKSDSTWSRNNINIRTSDSTWSSADTVYPSTKAVDNRFMESPTLRHAVTLTQAQYDALATKDTSTLYVIVG